jgi:hypothetical protein
VPEGFDRAIEGNHPGMANSDENDAGPTAGPTQMERDRPREPVLTEVESARTLQAQAKEELSGHGLDDEEIRKAADEYVAEGGMGDVHGFIAWALNGLQGGGGADA